MSQKGILSQGAGASGDVETLEGNSGGVVGPNGSGNIFVVGDGISATVVGNPGTNTLTITTAAGDFPITPFVVGPSGQAGYATIALAITAATASAESSNVIWIQPGTYTENLVIDSDIAFFSVDGVATITGVHSVPSSGTVSFHGLKMTSTTSILSDAAAGTTVISFFDCFFEVDDGYVFDLIDWTGELSMDNCGENSTIDGVVNNSTGGSSVKFINSEMGSGTARPMLLVCNGGFLRFDTCNVNCPVNMTGNGSIIAQNGTKFFGVVTVSDVLTGQMTIVTFQTGSAQCLTFGSTGSLDLTDCSFDSSNDPAIGGTGSGTLTLTGCSFPGNFRLATTLTIASGALKGGNFISQYVVAQDGTAPYTTIQSAVLDAVADGEAWPVIWVQPGTYTEDIDFSTADRITIAGLGASTIIAGTHTPNTTGTELTFTGCSLIDATAIVTSVGAGTTRVRFLDSFLSVTNGFVANLASWTGDIYFFYCRVSGTDDGGINNVTGGSRIRFFDTEVGKGTGQTMSLSPGGQAVTFSDARIGCPVSVAGTGSVDFTSATDFQGGLTIGGSIAGAIASCSFSTGAAAALTFSSSGALDVAGCTMDSSNNPCVDGAGVGALTLTGIDFISNASIAAGLTVTSGTSYSGTLKTDYTDAGVLLGQGDESDVVATAAGTSGQLLTGVTSGDPIWTNSTVGDSLGFSYNGGTGVFSIVGANGAALSASNPAFVTLPSVAAPGAKITYSVTSAQSFIDDAGVSEIIDNLFNFITSVAVAVDVPFYVYAVANDDDASVQFMLSRVPHYTVSPATTQIGTPSNAIADEQISFWSIDDVTVAEFDTNPCKCVGRIRMQMSTSDDWTVQALTDIDGVGLQDDQTIFTQPIGQLAAGTAAYTVANGGTAAVFSSSAATYQISADGVVTWSISLSGDAGQDGVGAVSAMLALPFRPSAVGNTWQMGQVSYAGGNLLLLLAKVGVVTVSVTQGSIIGFHTGVTAALTWGAFTNGARTWDYGLTYRIE